MTRKAGWSDDWQYVYVLICFVCVKCSKRFMWKEWRRRSSHWNSRCTTRGCLRLNFATNGSKRAVAPTEITASLLMALRSSDQFCATLVTRLRCAAWSSMASHVLMAIAATFGIHWLRPNNSRGQWTPSPLSHSTIGNTYLMSHYGIWMWMNSYILWKHYAWKSISICHVNIGQGSWFCK